jgi:hypothetical protein
MRGRCAADEFQLAPVFLLQGTQFGIANLLRRQHLRPSGRDGQEESDEGVC